MSEQTTAVAPAVTDYQLHIGGQWHSAQAGGRFEGGPGADVVDDFVSGVCVSASGCQA